MAPTVLFSTALFLVSYESTKPSRKAPLLLSLPGKERCVIRQKRLCRRLHSSGRSHSVSLLGSYNFNVKTPNLHLFFFFCDRKKNHLASCSLKIVSCTNDNCSETMTRNNLQKHVTTTCRWRILRCNFCSASHPECKKEVRIRSSTKVDRLGQL